MTDHASFPLDCLMGKKSGLDAATKKAHSNRRGQPTILESFEPVTGRTSVMDDSDDEIQMLGTNTSRSRATRVEKRLQLTREQGDREREHRLAELREQEDADLQRAIELSKQEAAPQEWSQEGVSWSQQTNPAPGEGVHHSQERARGRVEEEMDEDVLLGGQGDSTDEDRRSVKSDILLGSDEEGGDLPDPEINTSNNANLSRASDASGASVTFPVSHLNRRPVRKEGMQEAAEEETQLLEFLEGSYSEEEGVPPRQGEDEAVTGESKKKAATQEGCNGSQDLFSQGDLNHELSEEEREKAVIADSDDDFVMAEEEFFEENEVRKSSRLCLKRKRGPDDGTNRSSKATKTGDEEREEGGMEDDYHESREDREKRKKEEIERLVNGAFTLTRSGNPGDEGEKLTDSRKHSRAPEPFYCPPSVDPEEYTVAIVQMFQCYINRLRSHRLKTAGVQRFWSEPIRTGPHFLNYPIHRRRGARGPPDENDSDQEGVVERLEKGDGTVDPLGDRWIDRGDSRQRDRQEDRQSDADVRAKPKPKISQYVLDEDDDDDFDPPKVSGRRKLNMDSAGNNKRPRSEPQESAEYRSHPIVRPKPIKKQPGKSPRPIPSTPPESRQQMNSSGGRRHPSTPRNKTFDFGGDHSPKINNIPSGGAIDHSQFSEPSTPPRKLHRSSSNPEFGSFSGTSDKISADSSAASSGASPVSQASASQHPGSSDRGDIAGPSRLVAHVQPSSFSPWMSEASAKAGDSTGPSVTRGRDMEGGFIRENNSQMDMGDEQPAQDFVNGPPRERPHYPSPQRPAMPSPLGVTAPIDAPGMECPLCGQKFPISVIEAHASECNLTISLDDAVGNRVPIREQPKRAPVTVRHSSPQPPDPPRPQSRPDNHRSRPDNTEQKSGETNYKNPRLTKTRAKDTAPDEPTPDTSRPDHTRMDHVDAAILQMVENDEITIVQPRKTRTRSSRTLPPKDDKEEDEGDVYEIEDFEDEEENIPSKSKGGKKRKVRKEKCFLCGKMIPINEHSAHLDQHKEMNGQTSDTSPGKEVHVGVAPRSSSADRLPNGDSSSEERNLRMLYGGVPGGRRGPGGNSRDDSLEWTQPGSILSDEAGVDDSPIKAYQSIKETNSIVDFKNQFKEADSVKSRPQGRGRGGRRGRGRGKRRGRGRRKKSY